MRPLRRAFWICAAMPTVKASTRRLGRLTETLPQVMLAQFLGQVAAEIVFTPVTYAVVGWLKRVENEDYYDRNTDFNPFTLKA